MSVAEDYINGLKKAYFDNGAGKTWEHFEKIKHGASPEEIAKLRETFPELPDALAALLAYADGTYYRAYQGEEITLFFLGSDVDEYTYPYYLLSAGEMIENVENTEHYAQCIADAIDEPEWTKVDEKITGNPGDVKWLHFSDCMNNGGTSTLYVDFSPSEKGNKGQIVRFLHDPDEFIVIAESFDAYLKMLMENEYAFIDEETLEDV